MYMYLSATARYFLEALNIKLHVVKAKKNYALVLYLSKGPFNKGPLLYLLFSIRV